MNKKFLKLRREYYSRNVIIRQNVADKYAAIAKVFEGGDK